MSPRTTVVAVHGNGGGASRYERVATSIGDGLELRPITLPGFSTVPKDPALRTVADYADRVAEHVIEAGPGTVLLGHGIGGSFALDLASRRPELLGGLILHAPVAASLDTRWFPRLMSTPVARRAVQRLIAARPLRPAWRRLFFPHGAPRDALDGFFEEYRTCAAFGDMFEIIDAAWFDGLEPVRGVPSVLLWGADDRVLRSGQTDDVRAKVPEADVVVRDGWDHFPMIEQPEEYADEIASIARRLAARA